MLIRFLLVQRNPLDLCYFLAFFNNRYWKLKLNILNPISIFPSFREYINAFNKCLIKFLILINLSSLTIINNNTFRFVPAPPTGKFDHIFTDQELYEKYNLTPEKINIIESVIKERK